MHRKYFLPYIIVFLIFVANCISADDTKVKMFRATVKDGVQRVDIVGGDYYFDPNYIVVKVNVPVEFHVKKVSGIVPHDIVMDEPEAGITFKEKLGSEPKVITFTPKKTGVFPFYCNKRFLFFKSHRERGMEGVLEVVE
jgi:plastocyanin domain-containing protein